MTAPIGPTVRRRRLGTELRRLREANSIKLEEVAEQLGVAPSTLSRIETGKAPTRSAYLSEMLKLYGVEDPGQRQVLIDMAREGHRKGWWAAYEDLLPTGFGIYVGLEAGPPRCARSSRWSCTACCRPSGTPGRSWPKRAGSCPPRRSTGW